MAIWGLVIGEAASTLVSVTFFISGSENENAGKSSAVCGISGELPEGKYLKSLLAMAVPLTASRVTLNLFATFENSLIPLKLKAFGYSPSDALSVYGILTGMAMSVVMFPSVITNSVSVLLMPTISEARASCNGKIIDKAISGSIRYCMVLGFICTAGFLAAGSFLGNYLFANALAGSFIKTLGFICPFLYLTATLNSIMHGLGYPNLTFFLGGISCVIRILFVIFAIPFFGIKGYLAGLLASQIITAALTLIILKCKVKNRQI
jgi:stage V sporulation protein B